MVLMTKAKKKVVKKKVAKKKPSKKATSKTIKERDLPILPAKPGSLSPRETEERKLESKPDAPKETEAEMEARIRAKVKAENEKPYEISIKANKLKDGTIKVVVGPGEGARVLQGQVTEKGEDKWIDLCVISPPGAPNIKISPKKKVRELRLMLNKVELETAKI